MDITKKDQHVLKQFGKRLRKIRKDKGLSQEALGNISDLDRSYIGGVERGERNISLINIFRIASAIKVDAIVFLYSRTLGRKAISHYRSSLYRLRNGYQKTSWKKLI